MDGADLSFDRHGAARHDRAALSVLEDLKRVLASCPADRAGTRLYGVLGFAALLTSGGPIGRIAADRLGPKACPVRAILFDKTPGANWSLGWHQDRTIAVRERQDVPGYGPWSRKAGVQHVEPPFAVIEAMVTLRIHLDDVPADNAPLLVVPGSHRLGRLAEPDIARVVERLEPRCAWRNAVTFGRTRLRYSMHRPLRLGTLTGVCCKWITLLTCSPLPSNGWASDRTR